VDPPHTAAPSRDGRRRHRLRHRDNQQRQVDAEFFIEFLPGRPRPVATVLLKASAKAGGGRAWQIDLWPGTLNARVRGLDSEASSAAPLDDSIDLDAAGQRSTPW